MKFITRRFTEENNFLSIPILILSLLMTGFSLYHVALFYQIGSVWILLPICSTLYSLSLFYSLTSYSVIKSNIKGHYEIEDFYKIINPIKKVPFLIEYITALAATVFVPFLLVNYLCINTVVKEPNRLFYYQYFYFFLIYIISLGIYGVIRIKYFEYLENKVILNHEIINFFENFEGDHYIKKQYIDELKNIESEYSYMVEQCKNKFKKKNIIKDVLEIKKIKDSKSEIITLKEKLVKSNEQK